MPSTKFHIIYLIFYIYLLIYLLMWQKAHFCVGFLWLQQVGLP